MELARLLTAHPDAEADVRALVDEVQGRLPTGQRALIEQNITASAPGAVALGAMFGDVNYHAAPTGKPAPAAPQAPVSHG